MKKSSYSVFARWTAAICAVALLAVSLCIPAVAESNISLASEGEARYVIVYSQSAIPSEITAANTLADYLHRISGADFEVVQDTAREREREILVGKTNREESAEALRAASLGDEGVCLKTMGEKIVVAGDGMRGTLYAVYTLLEEYFGCRWFTEKLIVVPRNTEPYLPADLNYTYTPYLAYRESYWKFSTANTEFCVANKLNYGRANFPDSVGGISSLAVWGVHTLQYIVPSELFNTHPEYFGDSGDGTRTVSIQPCLSNPDVISMGINYALMHFREHSYSKVLSISGNDNRQPCNCEQCREFNTAHGGSAASMLKYVNTVADAVAKVYPDCSIETLAYQYTLAPPTDMQVADNVIIRFCNIGTCVIHEPEDKSCESNVRYDTCLKKWASLTDNILIWNYSTDFNYYCKLQPNISTLQSRYRYFRDNGIKGVFDQGMGEDVVPMELFELRGYLIAKLMWDADTDVSRHINEFCAAYYGEAGADVVEFISLFEKYCDGINLKTLKQGHLDCYGGGENTNNGTSLTERNIRELNSILERAKSRSITEEQLHRLIGLELSWRFFKCCTISGEFNWLSPFFDPMEESAQLFDDMASYGIQYFSEGWQNPVGEQYEPNFATRPCFWYTDVNELNRGFKTQAMLYPVLNKLLHIIFPLARFMKK